MSSTKLNPVPTKDIFMNFNIVQFVILFLGLFEFLLLHILLDRKRISNFFRGFQSQTGSTLTTFTNQAAKNCVDQSVSNTDTNLVLKTLGLFSDSDEDGEKIPERLDSNDIFNMFNEKDPSLDEVKEAFDVFDKNRDGFIDAADLHVVLCALGYKEGSDMEDCRRMISVFDVNGDDRIDFDEFIKLL